MLWRIVALGISMLVMMNAPAQTFMHGAGATISVLTAEIDNPASRYTATLAVTNVTWFPRIALAETDLSSFSIGIPLGAGIGISRSSGIGDQAVYIGFDIPVVVDYNRGRNSGYENTDRFGWYIGSGFGYMFTNWSDGYSSEKLNSYGPMARAGIRFGAGTNNPDQTITLGFYFKKGIEKYKFKTFGVVVLYEL